MIYINVGVVKSRISGDYPQQLISDTLFYRPEGYNYSPEYRSGAWDGKIRFLSPAGYFPTGLLPRVIEILNDRLMQYKLIHNYEKVNFANKQIRTVSKQDRDYQEDAVLRALKAKRGILKIATAGGKTVIAANIIRTIGAPAIFTTHLKSILTQTYIYFRNVFGEKNVGMVGSGDTDDTKPITVASIMTLKRNLLKYKSHLSTKKVLFADEVHHARSESWVDVLNKIEAQYRFGLTATPGNIHNLLRLEACTGPILVNIKTKELVQQGFVVPAYITFVRFDELTLPLRLSYRSVYRDGVEYCVERNLLIVRISKLLKEFERTPTLILVRTLPHLFGLEKLLNKTKLRVAVLNGSSPSTRRTEVIRLANSGALDVILATAIFDEGVDVPNIRSVITAGSGKSERTTIQRIGRGLRLSDKKFFLHVVDLYDTTHPYLQKHSEARMRIVKKEGHRTALIDQGNLERNFEDAGNLYNRQQE